LCDVVVDFRPAGGRFLLASLANKCAGLWRNCVLALVQNPKPPCPAFLFSFTGYRPIFFPFGLSPLSRFFHCADSSEISSFYICECRGGLAQLFLFHRFQFSHCAAPPLHHIKLQTSPPLAPGPFSLTFSFFLISDSGRFHFVLMGPTNFFSGSLIIGVFFVRFVLSHRFPSIRRVPERPHLRSFHSGFFSSSMFS